MSRPSGPEGDGPVPIASTANADFRWLLTAVGISAIGSRVTRTALPMTAVLLLDASPLQMGWLSVLGVLPGVFVAWWAGAWIDRRSRRNVMIGADWIRAVLIASVPIAALLGFISLVHLCVVAALVCVATVLFEIADHAILPAIVGRERLVAANARRETVDAAAEIGGPPLGGLLVQWLSAPLALAVDAFSFVASALAIGRIRAREPIVDRRESASDASQSRPLPRSQPPPQSQPPKPASLLREARDGFDLVWSHPLLKRLLLSTTLLTLFMNFMASLYTLYALRTLNLTPGLLGLVVGCGGVGALIGAALVGRLVRRFGAVPTARWSLIAGGLAQVFIPLAPADPAEGAAFLMLSQLLGDGLLTIYMITETSLRQKAVDDQTLGRAAAVWKMAASIVAPVGMVAGAVLAETIGIRQALWGLVIGASIAALPLIRFSSTRENYE